MRSSFSILLDNFRQISYVLFSIEFLLRLWSCPYNPSGRYSALVKGRLRYIASPLMLIDLLVLLFHYLPAPYALDLRILRIFRIWTLLGITRDSRPLQILVSVAGRQWRTAFALVIVMLSLLLLAASLMYTVERQTQPEAFGSIPASLWWAVATLTTVGYGDVIPHTAPGKISGMFVMFFGIAMFAIPTGIIVTSIAQELKRRDFIATWNLVARVPMFAKLDVQDIAMIADMLHIRNAMPGETIIKEGSRGDSMYFIVSGEVEVELEGNTRTLHDGEFFGELALLYKRPRNASVHAHTITELLQLEARDFEAFLEAHPSLRESITSAARTRLAQDAGTRAGTNEDTQ